MYSYGKEIESPSKTKQRCEHEGKYEGNEINVGPPKGKGRACACALTVQESDEAALVLISVIEGSVVFHSEPNDCQFNN